MKIRMKIAVIVMVILLVLFGVGGIFMGVYFFGMLDEQERMDIVHKNENLLNYIHDRAHTQASTLSDWAKWDDTYRFVQDENQDYIDDNLNRETFANLNQTFMVILNRSGRDIYHLYYDSAAGKFVDFPEWVLSTVYGELDRDFRQGRQYEDESGILSVAGEQYLFARASITDSAWSEDPDGVMVFGVRLNNDARGKMAGLAGGDVRFTRLDEMDAKVSTMLSGAAPDPKGIRSVSVKESKDSMATYILLDIDGRYTGYVLAVTSDRPIHLAGLKQNNLMLGLFCGLSLVFLLIMTHMLHVFIARPITNLIHEVSGIVPSVTSPRRLLVRGRGELAELTRSINGMLDKLEENFRVIKRGQEQFGYLLGEMRQGFTVHEVVLDMDGKPVDSTFIYANDSFKSIIGITGVDVTGKRLREVFPESAGCWINLLGDVALSGITRHIEDGETISGKYVEVDAYRPQPMQCVMLMNDITERRRAELEREYIGYHDQLTGLYNRRYFDEALQKLDSPENLPLTIMIGDLNGLKFTNDAFGHETGDRLLTSAANALRGIGRPQDVVARWGGDEFTILLPRTSYAEAEGLCNRIRESIARIEINSMRCSISLGYETKVRRGQSLRELLKNAEDHMYRSKMKEDVSGRGSAIQAIMTTFQERNEREKEHSIRVSRLCRLIAEAMGFTYEQATDMEISGLVHDIGKIAISDTIVNKRGKLSGEEWEEMKRHPEIGSRILSASSEMLVISGYVLAHHERWDGSGYPKGTAGKEIPLQARILAVADSYDAITSMRPYKLKMEVKDAVAELKRCAGKHFDPDVVKAFIENVLGYRPDESADDPVAPPLSETDDEMQAG